MGIFLFIYFYHRSRTVFEKRISFYIFIGEKVQDRQMEAIITFTNNVCLALKNVNSKLDQEFHMAVDLIFLVGVASKRSGPGVSLPFLP